jgi:hypothetical protein
LRAFVPGISSSRLAMSKKTGSSGRASQLSSSSTVYRVSMAETLNDVETIRCASRFSPGCAANTSRTSSCTSTVDGTAVEIPLSVMAMASP